MIWFGRHRGLGLIEGRVVRFTPTGPLKVPHMGWNQLKIVKETPIFKDIEDGSAVYFVHSYYVSPKDPKIANTKTDYEITFTSSILKDNIFACQFHPEKSQDVGLRLLKNFVEWIPGKS